MRRRRSVPRSVVVFLSGSLCACGAGPQPRDLSNAAPPSTRNTSAQVMNDHVETAVIEDSPFALAVLAQPDRLPEDRAFDTRRQAADVLTYLAVTPGMRVAELGAGGGYLTELLSRSVGASGEVFAVNPPSLVATNGVAAAWGARLARPANARVVRVDQELGAALPPEARGLDLVYLAVFYRDLPTIGVDRRLLVANALDALRPGGRLVVLDRAPSQPSGAGLDSRALHTEESRNARYEIERGGFHLAGDPGTHFGAEARFLRASTLTDDWYAFSAGRATSLEAQDRFFLTFAK